jgi:hypothetical protein
VGDRVGDLRLAKWRHTDYALLRPRRLGPSSRELHSGLIKDCVGVAFDALRASVEATVTIRRLLACLTIWSSSLDAPKIADVRKLSRKVFHAHESWITRKEFRRPMGWPICAFNPTAMPAQHHTKIDRISSMRIDRPYPK